MTEDLSNFPETTDFDFWMRASYWTIQEGAAIVLGMDPHVDAGRDTSKTAFTAGELIDFEKLVELSKRAQRVERLPRYPTPTEYLEWARSIDFLKLPSFMPATENELIAYLKANAAGEIPSDLLWGSTAMVDYKASYEGLEKAYYAKERELRELQSERWDLMNENNELADAFEGVSDALNHTLEEATSLGKGKIRFDDRSRKSLLKILLSIAIKKYNYNPNLQRSSSAANIANTTEFCDLSVSDETIRDHLKSAVAEFPMVRNLFD